MTDVLKVYHGTSFENLASILKEGVRPPSFWANERQALIPYATLEEAVGRGGAVIAVRISDHKWHEMEKETFNFLPITGTAEEIDHDIAWCCLDIICLDHISPDAIEVVYTSEPDLSKRRFKRS